MKSPISVKPYLSILFLANLLFFFSPTYIYSQNTFINRYPDTNGIIGKWKAMPFFQITNNQDQLNIDQGSLDPSPNLIFNHDGSGTINNSDKIVNISWKYDQTFGKLDISYSNYQSSSYLKYIDADKILFIELHGDSSAFIAILIAIK